MSLAIALGAAIALAQLPSHTERRIAGPPPERLGPALCVERALEETDLAEHDAVLLCQMARDDGPVDCYQRARRNTGLQKHNLLRLCSPSFYPPVVPLPY